jgi:hypothetical protein
MKRFLGFSLVLGILFAISTFTHADDPKKSYGSGQSSTSKQDTSGKKSYGSGGQPKPKTDPPKHDDKKDPPSKGKSYGSGGTPSTGKSYGSGNHSTQPDAGGKPKGTYDQKGGVAQQHKESKEKFQQGQAPAPTYTDSRGKVQQIDPKDKKIEQLRGQLSEEKWKNRELRRDNFYHQYTSRPVVVYHDPYSSFFWYWLLDRTIEQQAMWAYCHRYDMDSARYNDLLARNADLRARVIALEAQRVARDPHYTPAGMNDPDLQYTDDYIRAAYNPHPVASQPVDASGVLHFLLILFLVLAIIALVVWLIFVKKWGSA